MAKTVSVIAKGECARDVVRFVATQYAMLCLKCDLPHDRVANAPWFSTAASAHEFMRVHNSKRADYKRSLFETLGQEPPLVPMVDWPSNADRPGWIIYSGPRALVAAKAYADAIEAMLMQPARPQLCIEA